MGRNNQQRRRAKAKDRHAHRTGPTRSSSDAPPATSAFAAEFEQLELERTASEALSEALHWMDYSRATPAARAIGRLEELCVTSAGARAVTAVLARSVETCVGALWERGWQPLDVTRLAGRRLTQAEQDLLVDVMAVQAASYAAATVDPRWAAQLREVGAHDSAGGTAYLESHRVEHGWGPTMTHAVTVIHLLMCLPRLETLMPRPGTYRATAGRSRTAATIDERILRRVRALLAKAESTNYEAEAETFTAGAQALMARHSIDAALLATEAPAGGQRPSGRRIGIDNPYEAQKAMLLQEVASANRCRTVWSKDLGFATVVGFESDLDAVEVLFTSLLVQATRAMTAAGRRTDRLGRSRTRSFRSSFLTGYARRIGERLREAADAQVEEAQAEADLAAQATAEPAASASSNAPQPTRGRELVPLLTARSAEVDQAMEAMFPEMIQRRVGGGYDGEGWASGRAAADLANLGTGSALPGRPSTATG